MSHRLVLAIAFLFAVAGCGARTGLFEAEEPASDIAPEDPGGDEEPEDPVDDTEPEEPVDDTEPEDPGGDTEPKSCVHPKVVKDCNGGWCRIPAGCFYMGDEPGSIPCADPAAEEIPRTVVTLTHSFEISQTEVTREEYKKIIGKVSPTHHPATGVKIASGEWPDRPVFSLSWEFAADYCNQLSKSKGLDTCYWGVGVKTKESAQDIYSCPGYRLPTAAEWEYAYRAGSTTDLYTGLLSSCREDDNAAAAGWYLFNTQAGEMNETQDAPRDVGLKLPNAWGLYDMAGNVWEWVHDAPAVYKAGQELTNPPGGERKGDDNVEHYQAKGGSILSSAIHLRAAHRQSADDFAGVAVFTHDHGQVGLRCVRTLNP